MRDPHSAPPIVAGVDGSPAALSAALWAAHEAANRHLALKLVYVIYNADRLCGTEQETDQLAVAHAALSDAYRAVAADPTVRVETEVLRGNPLATLIELSQSAAMVCVGSIGIKRSCHRAGSTAAALAGSAKCPVAVIRRPDPDQRDATGYIVAEVDAAPDNNAVLSWAMTEARLRRAPLRAVAATQSQPGGGDTDLPAKEKLNRRIDHWVKRYPDVAIEPVLVHDSIAEYLARQSESVQLFVSGNRDRRSLGWPGGSDGCSVLTVGGSRT